MSLILKSNVATNLKRLNDNFLGAKLIMDFRDNYFVKNGEKVSSVDDLLVKSGVTAAGSYDAYGNYSEVSPNVVRTSTDLTNFKKGMYIEQSFVNHFKNAKTPVSQTVEITVPADLTYNYVLSVVGSGSATLTVDGVLVGTATPHTPVSYKPTIANKKTFVVEVSGDLSYVGLLQTVQNVDRVTQLDSLTVSRTYTAGKISVRPVILAEVIPTFTGCLVLKNHIPANVNASTTGKAQSGTIAQIKSSDGNGVFIARQERGNITNILRLADGSGTKTIDNNNPLQLTNIYAVNFSPSGAKLAVNGVIVGSLEGVTSPTDIFIGAGDAWSFTVTQYIEQVAIFDRQLTDDELSKITSL